MSTSDIIQTLSKALTLLPEDSLLEVLVMTRKAASKHLAKNKTCPFQNSCRFGDRCWYIHTRNPYAPSPSFSQRHHVAQTQPPHHPVAERSTTTAKSDQGISPTCPAVTGPFDPYIPLTTSSSTAPQSRATTPRQAQPPEPNSPPSSNVSINVIQEQSTTSPPVLSQSDTLEFKTNTQHCCTSSFRHHETLWDAVISGFFASMVQCMPCRVE